MRFKSCANAKVILDGSIDTEHCDSQVYYRNLTSATYWQFKMSAISIGNYTIKTGWEVISDTGTSFIGAPQEASFVYLTIKRKIVRFKNNFDSASILNLLADSRRNCQSGGRLLQLPVRCILD